MQLGFKLAMPPGLQLRWLRLRVEVLGKETADANPRSVAVLSYLPQAIRFESALAGRMPLDDEGKLVWEQGLQSPAGTSALRFQPFARGYQTNPFQVTWDWLPFNGRSPSGTDALHMTVRVDPATQLYLRESVQLCVEHQAFGKKYLQYPPALYLVRTAQPL